MNPLNEALPPAARKYVYGLVALAATVWAAWQGAQGDWAELVGGVIVALNSELARSNVSTYDPKHDI